MYYKKMSKFSNKYRIESQRMPEWDYSGNGYYFITMMIDGRECILGKIANDEMIFSDFGKIANDEWYKSFEIRNELVLDEYTFMPNHLHAIIIIDKSYCTSSGDRNGCRHVHGHVQTHDRASLQAVSAQSHPSPKLHRKPKSLSSFIAGYKSAVTTKIDDFIDLNNLPIAKYNRNNKLWQINYHDHIIRDIDEYWSIKNYIRNNPKNWDKDILRD